MRSSCLFPADLRWALYLTKRPARGRQLHSGIMAVAEFSMKGNWSRLWKKCSVEIGSITHAKEIYALDRQIMLAYRNSLEMVSISCVSNCQ
jgi:hypothetical protein